MRAVIGFAISVGLVWLGVLMGDQFPPDHMVGQFWPWPVVAGVSVLVGTVIESVVNRTVWRVALIGAGLTGLAVWFAGWVPASVPGQRQWPWALLVGGPLLLGAVLVLWRRSSGSIGLVNRWSRRSRRNDGVASWWTVWRTASARAMRRKATVLRPSLRALSWCRRRRVPVRELATPLARVGLVRVWSPVEDVTLRIGGPRQGKTGELAGRILDAPGAVIATSTRTDLVELTGPVRSLRGPVHVFNPSGLGGLGSTIRFDPLSGCGDPTVATSRASDLLAGVSAPGGAGGDREFWAGQARRVLASLMHAAALGQMSMRDVLRWVADPDNQDTVRDIHQFLARSSEPAFELDALQFLNTNARTRSSICATIMPALGWLTDSTAARAATGGGFYVKELLDQRGTVYMLGAEDAQVAPLVTALTGHIAREARRIAGDQPGGRLDPPLTLALDEAALICPIPLDNWTADMGGRNVTIHIAAQSRAQLRQRWGDTGAAAIMNNAATLLIFGGTRDPDDLAAYSTLAGERDEHVNTYDTDGTLTAVTSRRVPVLSPAQISQLPARRVLIIRRGMPPAVGRVRMAWKRWDVRAERIRARWALRLERWSVHWERFAVRAAELWHAAALKVEPWMERLSRTTRTKPERHRVDRTRERVEEWTR